MEQDIKVEHDIIKKPLSYVHTMTVVYPKDNVHNMMKSWEQSVEDSQSFLTQAGEARKAAEEQGLAQIDEEAKRITNRIEELTALSREERAEVLLKEFDEFVAREKENLVLLEDKKKQYLQEIEKEIKRQQEWHRDNLKKKKDALQLWATAKVQ